MGLPKGELTTGEPRRSKEGECSRSSPLGVSLVVTLCTVPVLSGLVDVSEFLCEAAEIIVESSMLSAAVLREGGGVMELAKFRGLTGGAGRGLGEEEEEMELESKFPVLALISLVTEARRPTPLLPISWGLALRVSPGPALEAALGGSSLLTDLAFFLGGVGDWDFALEPAPPPPWPIIPGPATNPPSPGCSRRCTLFSSAGFSLLTLSPVLPPCLLELETEMEGAAMLDEFEEFVWADPWPSGFADFGGGRTGRFLFSEAAGSSGFASNRARLSFTSVISYHNILLLQ